MSLRLTVLFAALAALAFPALAEPPAQAGLEARVRALGSGFDGHAGVAVMDLKDGWTVSWDGDDRFSQESVAKLWTVIVALDAVDSGRIQIDEEVPVTRADLSVFHEPLEDRIGSSVTIAELVRAAIVESDNAANDLLVRRLGGTSAVQAVMRRKGLSGIVAGIQQRDLQARVAGLQWRPELDGGERLEAARARLDPEVREAAMRRYLASPDDGAEPVATARALKALYEGKLLSPESTQRLIALMHSTVHGEERLNGGLERGWTLAHKTGTGQHLGPLHVGTNDVGILTAPDGHAYAVAVFEGSSTAPLIVREGLMRRIAEAVVETWQADR